MIKAILDYFENNLAKEKTPADTLRKQQLAAAALFTEMMRMDHHFDERESQAIINALNTHFSLDVDDATEIMTLAEQQADEATDYYQFTSLINKAYSYEEKIALVESLWKVAYADSQLDKYEEHYLRKISDLLYVKHKDFIQSKHRVMRSKNIVS